MPSLKDLKNRINSVKSTRKITKAMQMVASAKLRRAQEAAEAARPYAEKMAGAVANLARAAKDSPTAPKLLAGSGAERTHLLLVCTSERGLCGGFNSSIVRLAKQKIMALEAEGRTVKIITVGKKGRDQLRREHSAKIVLHVDQGDVAAIAPRDRRSFIAQTAGNVVKSKTRVDYADAQTIAEEVVRRFLAEEFDVCHLFFSAFQSVVVQVPTVKQIIPVTVEAGEDAPGERQQGYEYEPEEDAILADLLPRAIAVQIFTALLENAASEQGARMSAMDNATRNAGEMIDRLTIVYNRSRQAAITKELIEIISGAEAL